MESWQLPENTTPYGDGPIGDVCVICGKELTPDDETCTADVDSALVLGEYTEKCHIDCVFVTSAEEVKKILEHLRGQLLDCNCTTKIIYEDVFDKRFDPYALLREMERSGLVRGHRTPFHQQDKYIVWEVL